MRDSTMLDHVRRSRKPAAAERDTPVRSLDSDPVWAAMMDHLHTHMQDRKRLYELLAR